MRSFIASWKREKKASGTWIWMQLVKGMLIAGVTQLLVNFALIDRDAWGLYSTADGTFYAYSMLAAGLIMLRYVFFNRLFSYSSACGGSWYFAVRCGSKPGALCISKLLSILTAPLITFAAGAAANAGICYLEGFSLEDMHIMFPCLAVGAATTEIFVCVTLICAVLGADGGGLSVMSAVVAAAAAGLWYVTGYLTGYDEASISAAAGRLIPSGYLSLYTLLAAAALIACILALTVPVRKMAGHDAQDLDDDMLKNMEFRQDQEVYEKRGESYELVFKGTDIYQNKK